MRCRLVGQAQRLTGEPIGIAVAMSWQPAQFEQIEPQRPGAYLLDQHDQSGDFGRRAPGAMTHREVAIAVQNQSSRPGVMGEGQRSA